MKHNLGVAISTILTVALFSALCPGSPPSTTHAAEILAHHAAFHDAAGAQLAPQPTPTPTIQRLARFNETAGAFSIRYPVDLNRIRSLDVPDIYGYMFTNAATSTVLAVGFLVVSETELSDGEWRVLMAAMGPQGIMRRLGSPFDDPAFVEVARELGETGTHQLYWEGKYEKPKSSGELLHSALFVQETTGILAIVAVVTTSEDWNVRRTLFSEVFESLEWSSEVVRAQLGGTALPTKPAPTEETAVLEITPEIVTPTEEATPLPEEVPAEGGEISPETIIESLFPKETEEATPSEEVDVITPEETPGEEIIPEEPVEDVIVPEEPGIEETPPEDETVTFEDPNGVFELTYPAVFDTQEGPYIEGEGYVYATSIGGDENYFVGVYFGIMTKRALSDAEWEKAVDPIVGGAIGQVGADAVELYRERGKRGQHWIYFEAESEYEDRRMFFYIEEASGVLAILMGGVPLAEWSNWEDAFAAVVRSFQWSSDAAREVLSGESAEPPAQPTSTPPRKRVIPTPTPIRKLPTPTPKIAQPALPAGKGGLVMLNCRGDVVTVDVIPDAIFQELAPKTGEECYRGKPIYLDPGEHILKASIAGVSSHGEATIIIVEGEWLEFTWY
ncbi:MAG: hypothetical protein NZ765_03990 [Anaerolineae bacterium]|nr:hypothetical protein [Anaerolineae bacterium]MDW8072102.1 hypothetical protein [Anaerolineae bacterium]